MNILSLYHNYFGKVDSSKLGQWPSPSDIQRKKDLIQKNISNKGLNLT